VRTLFFLSTLFRPCGDRETDTAREIQERERLGVRHENMKLVARLMMIDDPGYWMMCGVLVVRGAARAAQSASPGVA